MDIVRLIDGLWEQTEAFAEAVRGIDPDTVVPTCPKWRLRTLVGHIGQEHRWAAGLVRTREPAPVPDVHDADPGPPEEWTAWLRDGAAELTDAVKETGAETMVWGFVGPQPAAAWVRRMLHDTSVHHADAALTAGVRYEVAPDLAADAIDEGLELISTPGAENALPALANLRGTGQTIALRPAEGTGWLITRNPGGVNWRHAAADADVTVAGPVRDVLLVFMRRLSPDRITVAGDRALLDHWLANTAF